MGSIQPGETEEELWGQGRGTSQPGQAGLGVHDRGDKGMRDTEEDFSHEMTCDDMVGIVNPEALVSRVGHVGMECPGG